MEKQELYSLLGIGTTEKESVCVTIYTDQQGSRLEYACHFIFTHVLKCRFEITTNKAVYEKAPFKINYSYESFHDQLQILPSGLLIEKELSSPDSHFKETDGIPVLFSSPIASATSCLLGFDIFSAVFFCISRLEEWQNPERDEHGRFEAKHSCLFSAGILNRPIADEWILLLKQRLLTSFNHLSFPETKFKYISTIDVDNLFAYRHKGFFRTIGGLVKDAVSGRFAQLKERISVLSGARPDPFDVYETLGQWAREGNYSLFYFFLYSNASKYDRTVKPGNKAFQKVLKKIGASAFYGLHPSYNTFVNDGLFKQELKDWQRMSGQNVRISRQHYLRFDIRTTPQQLMEQGIWADFSMGFATQTGFRAGTSHPFHYFNFNTNQPEELLLVPFAFMDGYYFVYNNYPAQELFNHVNELALNVQQVNGLLIGVTHERSFSNAVYKGFASIYKKLGIELRKLT
ncbi:MAG: hypothetical protein QM534_01665 [Sediminibacterium sp.]|nr:hypothetical protein [Sediminibacterium sp.]